VIFQRASHDLLLLSFFLSFFFSFSKFRASIWFAHEKDHRNAGKFTIFSTRFVFPFPRGLSKKKKKKGILIFFFFFAQGLFSADHVAEKKSDFYFSKGLKNKSSPSLKKILGRLRLEFHLKKSDFYSSKGLKNKSSPSLKKKNFFFRCAFKIGIHIISSARSYYPEVVATPSSSSPSVWEVNAPFASNDLHARGARAREKQNTALVVDFPPSHAIKLLLR
jgi:hypothetical protein